MRSVMKIGFLLLLVFCLALMPMIVLSATSDTGGPPGDKPFSEVAIALVQQFFTGLDWHIGYAASLRVGQKQGVILTASRSLYVIRMNGKEVDLNGDLIALKGQNDNNDMFGLGFSASLKEYLPFNIGIGYLPAGYGWSVTMMPVSVKF